MTTCTSSGASWMELELPTMSSDRLWTDLADRLLIKEGVLDDAESTGEIMGEQLGIVGDDDEEMVVVRDKEWSSAR